MDTVRNITKQKVFETLKITFEQEKDQGGILNIQKAARPKQTKVPGYGDSSLATWSSSRVAHRGHTMSDVSPSPSLSFFGASKDTLDRPMTPFVGS